MTKEALTHISSVGHVIDSYGVKGWVKLKLDTQDFDSLAKAKAIYLLVADNWQAFSLQNYQLIGKIVRAKFNNIEDRDQALALKGSMVGIDRRDFPTLEHNEYYWADLIGCKVLNERGDEFGVVNSLMDTGANSVLVTKIAAKQYLIPFVDKHLVKVDPQNNIIIVAWEFDY